MARDLRATTSERTTDGSGFPRDPSPSSTHGLTVIGWMLACFSVAPLAMAAVDRRPAAAWVGAGMLLAGIGAVVAGRRMRDSD